MSSRRYKHYDSLSKVWDAVVVGAGPAGAVAARQLALQGKGVLLVDKARFPRDKVCGGCLGGAALGVLKSIGLSHILQTSGARSLDTFTLASDGCSASVPIGRRAAISRRTFDAALVEEAALAGVVVRNRTLALVAPPSDEAFRTVILKNDGSAHTVHAKVALIATGLGYCPGGHETRVAPASRMGLSAILEQSPCEVPSGVLLMACTSAGYVGVTAVEDGKYDVAAAVDPHALSTTEPGRLIHRILDQAGFAPAIDLQEVRWQGTPRLTRRTIPLATHRCLLIGDAAGYVEPFTGEGIGWAMSSAVLAASLLADPLDQWRQQTATQWERAYRAAFSRHQQSCRILSRLLRVKCIRRIATWGLCRAPTISRPIIRRLDQPIDISVY
jgi:flavin-dependent dehydrogenase